MTKLTPAQRHALANPIDRTFGGRDVISARRPTMLILKQLGYAEYPIGGGYVQPPFVHGYRTEAGAKRVGVSQ